MPAMIFHHPFPVAPDGSSGSRVRPYQMLKAFKELGYDVAEVTGYGAKRKERIGAVLKDIRKGKRFNFIYSESHTLPMYLTEKHHLPTYMFLDQRLMQVVKKASIPIGLFYRDIYWGFDHFAKALPSIWKRYYTKFFYHHEWKQYKRFIDHLFLPSLAMAKALPTAWPNERISALPPGIDTQRIHQPHFQGIKNQINLFYVGGVTPPLYDLTPLFGALTENRSIHLTLCCRPEEWASVRDAYGMLPHNVEVVHLKGEELIPYYCKSDAFVIIRKPDAYLDFAMPVKLFEALTYGLPVITSAGTEVAKFVARENLGWVVSSNEDFKEVVHTLVTQPTTLSEAYKRVQEAQKKHTWQTRAQQVADTLEGL
jgi:glycosyltransferase involved in cell wall biosynthesis